MYLKVFKNLKHRFLKPNFTALSRGEQESYIPREGRPSPVQRAYVMEMCNHRPPPGDNDGYTAVMPRHTELPVNKPCSRHRTINRTGVARSRYPGIEIPRYCT